MKKKYKLTDEPIYKLGIKLYRIEALKDFGDVKKGDIGGYVESEKNKKMINYMYNRRCLRVKYSYNGIILDANS